MKETYNYPKTLRNYQENAQKIKPNKNSLSNRKNHKSFSNLVYKPNYGQQEQMQNIDEYCILTSPLGYNKVNEKRKKNKMKENKDSSHLSAALKEQLKRSINIQSYVGPQNIVHCKSLQKLQIISNDRSQQIKKLMRDKAALFSQNEQLKAKIINPTFRQQQYIQKIVQRDLQIQNLKQKLKRKQQRILQMQKQSKSQIQRLKVKHQQQTTCIREQMIQGKYSSKKYEKPLQSNYVIRTNNNENKSLKTQPNQIYSKYTVSQPFKNQSISQPKVYTTSYNNNRNQINHVAYQPRISSNNNQTKLKDSQNYNNVTNLSTKLTSSANNLYTEQKKISPSKEGNKNYRTYVGEDGYERRIYYKEGQQYKYQNIKSQIDLQSSQTQSKNENVYSSQLFKAGNDRNNIIQKEQRTKGIYQDNKSLAGIPFTNERINYNLNQQQNKSNNISVYRVGEFQYNKLRQKSGQKHNDDLHNNKNENMYSNSLTFQCFSTNK